MKDNKSIEKSLTTFYRKLLLYSENSGLVEYITKVILEKLDYCECEFPKLNQLQNNIRALLDKNFT